MTSKRQKQKQVEHDMGLLTFDSSIHFQDIACIANIDRSGQKNVDVQVRHGCLIRMAYFMVLSACIQLSLCMDPGGLFEMTTLLNTVEYKTAVSTMYLLVDLLTAPIYSTQYKLKKIERVALQACAVLSNKHHANTQALRASRF